MPLHRYGSWYHFNNSYTNYRSSDTMRLYEQIEQWALHPDKILHMSVWRYVARKVLEEFEPKDKTKWENTKWKNVDDTKWGNADGSS